MSTARSPLDLDAIRERLRFNRLDAAVAVQDDILALISEVEALRVENDLLRIGARVNEMGLCAKLDKAKGALRFTATSAERPSNLWPMAIDAAKEALEELER